MSDKHLDFDEFRDRVGDKRPVTYWRSLDELSRSPVMDEYLQQEFPQQALPLSKGVDRRDFVKLMSASMALAGLAACNRPAEKIVPYVKQPEGLIPGKPLFFATAMTLGGYATGVLAESHMNRPTKLEGNPDHPSSLGATDAFVQGSLLGLYDPDREQVVRHMGEIATWSEFVAALQPVMKAKGAGVRLLTQTITSPSLGAQIQQLIAANPGLKWHQWEPANRDNEREGMKLAFGSYVHAVYDFAKADVIVSLDSDFMGSGPGHLAYARAVASRRRVRKGQTTSMNRIYAIESSPTSVGAVADHRLPVRPSQIEGIARGLSGSQAAAPEHAKFVAAVAKDLQAHRGASVVIAGAEQPPAVHALAMAINQALGNIGSTVMITDSPEVMPMNQLESLRQLVTDMNAGQVEALIMIGGNPVFDAPADFQFEKAFDKVPFRAHLSHYYDETSMLCHWHIPETHYLETWGDARGHDGTVSIQQPLIAPLYNGRSAYEVIGGLIGGMDQSPYDTVRAYWSQKAGGVMFENTWRQWLNDGVIKGSALPAKAATAAAPPAAQPSQPAASGLEIILKPDPTIHDGRFANIGWLQELPKPHTKITWDNPLLVSPATAKKLGIGPSEAMINEKETYLATVTVKGKSVTVPVWIVPGHADDCATVFYGYGRRKGGRVATILDAKTIDAPTNDGGVGFDTYPLRNSDALHIVAGAQIANKNETYIIACTQEHQSLNPEVVGQDRGIIRAASFEEYKKNPGFAFEGREEETKDESIWPKYRYDTYDQQYAWAMSIDTSVCTGCNGCVIACQSENNIAVVGKTEVHREREMHWLRIDRYYKGSPENPEIYHQPVPCMQCENAPCEPVCPVGATSHNQDGLNDMTYNRCVGTRYCSNNCPYKVRRFNFFHYSDYDTVELKPMRNPDVTVRTRGVMEKCTYCVQRINYAKIEAEKQNRRVKDGEIVTACQQACPTDAIVFGDLNDKNSRVNQLKAEPTNYALLAELNTRPRTTYLATIRNPNPELEK